MSEEATSSPGPADAVGQLEARLGVRFADRGLALAALTHKSFVNEHRGEGLSDNERLEFLGDAVIDLAVSHRLMARFPEAREGDLSKMRAAVVDETGLAEMARDLELGALLRLGRGEELTGGRRKASLLADAMEAVVAALFLGSGLESVLELVDRFLGHAFQRAAAGTLDRDFKTQLQELAQSRFRATPRYRVVAEHGPDHSKTFEIELELKGEALGRGRGRSKKDAEQAAAKLAMDELVRRLEAEGVTVAKEPPVPDVGAVPLPPSAPIAPLPVTPASASAADGSEENDAPEENEEPEAREERPVTHAAPPSRAKPSPAKPPAKSRKSPRKAKAPARRPAQARGTTEKATARSRKPAAEKARKDARGKR
jgi:ribonuclease III